MNKKQESKKTESTNNGTRNNGTAKKESLVKVIAVTVLALLGLSLLSTTFFSNNQIPMGHGMMNRGHMGNVSGTGLLNGTVGDVFIGLISLLMHLLWVFVLVALVLGLVFLGKKALEQNQAAKQSNTKAPTLTLGKCHNCGSEVSEEYKFCPECRASLKESCNDCGKELQRDWNCCPVCGKSKGAIDK